MKLLLALRFSLLASLVAAGARAEVEFAGYIKTAAELKFVLTDPAAKRTSDWLAVGGSFSGYKITGYDARTETLSVEKDGTTTQLRLKGAGTGGARPWWETWDRADVSQLTGVQISILRFEDAVWNKPKLGMEFMWLDYYSEELDKVKFQKRQVREAAAAGKPVPKNLLPESDYAELLRHMLSWLHEKKRTLGVEIRNRDSVLQGFDRHIAQTEKELAK